MHLCIPLVLLGSVVLGEATPGQSRPRIERDARIERAPSPATVAFEGFVLGPDGGPAAGAVVVSSAGGKAVTELDGHYRLAAAVPLEAESVQITAAAGGNGSLASAKVDLIAGRRGIHDRGRRRGPANREVERRGLVGSRPRSP